MVAAAAIAGSIAAQAVVATAAEQDQQDDDPANVTATETVVIHNEYLQNFFSGFAAHSMVFHFSKNVTAFAARPQAQF